MDHRLQLLKKLFQLEDKEVEWGVIEVTTRTDGGEETAFRPGLLVKDSRVCLDVFARRFYSLVDRPDITRKIHSANLLTKETGLVILDEDDSENEDEDVAIFTAKDNQTEDLVYSASFIEDVFGVTVYTPGLEDEFLL